MELLGQLAAAPGDRYRLERELCRGGMAVVFLAEDLKHRRRVAIKVLKPELSAVLGSDRFVREIEIAATLDVHRCIRRLFAPCTSILRQNVHGLCIHPASTL